MSTISSANTVNTNKENKEVFAPIINPLKDDQRKSSMQYSSFADEEDDEDITDGQTLFCCQNQEKFLGLKIDTLVRMMRVCIAFPFVIVVSSLNLSNKYSLLK
jgi:hypothetical protein